MLKTKRKQFVIAIVMFSMVAMYGFMPVAKAASLESARDTISDSDLSATGVTHTIVFQSDIDLQSGIVVTLDFNSNLDITDATTGTCPNGTWASTTNQVTCTLSATISSSTNYTITVPNTVNPGTAGSYDVTISHNGTSSASSEMLVYIIDDVTVSAHVNASLTFGIGTTTDGTSVNGDSTTGTSTPTAIDFSTLTTGSGGRQIIAQSLTVSTNAASGYSVTVEQDHDLETGAGSNINSFVDSPDGTGSSTNATIVAWQSPGNSLGNDTSYGHFGLTTSDDTLDSTLWSVADPFGNQEYAGLNSTDTMQVMYHGSSADGSTDDIGQAYVAYSIEITDLQEAGDYSNTLTYICTPNF